VPPCAQRGKLPLHSAVENEAGSEVVLLLLSSDVAFKLSNQSYLLSKEFAERREQVLAVLLADLSAQLLADLSAQESVVVRHPTSEPCDAVDGGKKITHTFYSWSKLVSETGDKCNDIVKAILNTRKHDAQKLADLCDASGRKAIDM